MVPILFILFFIYFFAVTFSWAKSVIQYIEISISSLKTNRMISHPVGKLAHPQQQNLYKPISCSVKSIWRLEIPSLQNPTGQKFQRLNYILYWPNLPGGKYLSLFVRPIHFYHHIMQFVLASETCIPWRQVNSVTAPQLLAFLKQEQGSMMRIPISATASRSFWVGLLLHTTNHLAWIYCAYRQLWSKARTVHNKDK